MEQLRTLPKAEVHLHLEGTLSPEEVARLASEAGEPVLAYSAQNLTEFLRYLDWSCGLVRTPEQVARVAYACAAREAASGVRYVDVIVNPTHWPSWRTRLDAFVDALDAGFAEAEQDGLPPAGVCLSLLRQQSAAEALELVDWMLERRHPRLVALSIDGNEAAAGRTGPRFAEAFSRARDAGLHRVVHAGESSGPEGVWDAIDLLHAERVDHGVRAIEDPALVATLAERRIPLDVCLTSNLRLKLYPDAPAHPLDRLRQAGVPVSLNTDDPALFETSVVAEYALAASTYGWSDSDVREVARTSIEASFCPPELRSRLFVELA